MNAICQAPSQSSNWEGLLRSVLNPGSTSRIAKAEGAAAMRAGIDTVSLVRTVVILRVRFVSCPVW